MWESELIREQVKPTQESVTQTEPVEPSQKIPEKLSEESEDTSLDNLPVNKTTNDFNDDHFEYEFAAKTEVNKKLTDVEEDEDEGESYIEEEKWSSSQFKSSDTVGKWIWDKLYKYSNPCADEIADIIK